MNNWVYLGLAIFSEVIATASQVHRGVPRFVPSIVVLVGYSAAFYFLSLTLTPFPLAWPTQCGRGLAWQPSPWCRFVVYDQKIDAAGLLGIGLIVAGVVVLRVQ